MRKLKTLLLATVAGLSVISSGPILAWGDSFSFGDSWNEDFGKSSWSTPDWGTSYTYGKRRWARPYYGGPTTWGRPTWGGPTYYSRPGGSFYPPPRINSYDRTIMKNNRQSMMSEHDSAMDHLADMLYGRYRFDREDAIDYAREIENDSGLNLVRNFHPGSVATDGSHTAPTLWGNEQSFRAYAEALRTAAKALREELEKRPAEGENAMYPRRDKGFDYRPRFGTEDDPISPDVMDKFNDLAATCITCHSYFRGPDW
jgi:cytochrome c556